MNLLETMTRMSAGVVDEDRSICGNIGIGEKQFSMKLALKSHFITWASFSGNLNYPIPATNPSLITGFSSYKAASWQYTQCSEALSFWEGAQGMLRRELLHHIIKEIQNESAI